MHRPRVALVAIVLAAVAAPVAGAQDVRIADVVLEDQAVPVRLVGYGLVVGLSNTGDRGTSGRHGGGMTVQSVVNLLRRFDLEVPPEAMRTRNAAAVLVTAELNPYLRAGARFTVEVSSIGDAHSLQGGVLWMTPLQADPDGPVLATAQGPLLLTGAGDRRYRVVGQGANSARIPDGGIVEGPLPRPAWAQVARLNLRNPDVGTAVRIAAAVNGAIGPGTASVEDPGSVALTISGDAASHADALARIRELRVTPTRRAALVIDARAGTVVAGGDIGVGDATVSHEGITLSIGGPPAPEPPPAAPAVSDPRRREELPVAPVRVASGTPAVRIADALRVVGATPRTIAAIFVALRDAGALAADVDVR